MFVHCNAHMSCVPVVHSIQLVFNITTDHVSLQVYSSDHLTGNILQGGILLTDQLIKNGHLMNKVIECRQQGGRGSNGLLVENMIGHL